MSAKSKNSDVKLLTEVTDLFTVQVHPDLWVRLHAVFMKRKAKLSVLYRISLMMKIWVLTAVFSKTVRNLSERTQCVKENV